MHQSQARSARETTNATIPHFLNSLYLLAPPDPIIPFLPLFHPPILVPKFRPKRSLVLVMVLDYCSGNKCTSLILPNGVK